MGDRIAITEAELADWSGWLEADEAQDEDRSLTIVAMLRLIDEVRAGRARVEALEGALHKAEAEALHFDEVTDRYLCAFCQCDHGKGKRRGKKKRVHASDCPFALLATSATPPAPGRDALMDALEFYADPDTYFAIGFSADRPCGGFEDDFEEIDDPIYGKIERPGKRARAALAKYAPPSGGQPQTEQGEFRCAARDRVCPMPEKCCEEGCQEGDTSCG